MDRIITAWICLLLFSATAWGQGNYWEEIPGPYGGFCTLAKTGNGQLYGIYNSGVKVYRSDDNGNNWEPVFEEGIATFTFSIGSTGTFYRKNVVNWQKSLNEGADWEQMPANSNAMANLVEIADNTFIGHGSGYFFISQDGGNSWTQTSDLPLTDNRSVDRLDITPYGGVVASTFGSNNAPKIFYRSTDGGQNWQRIEIPPLSSTLFVAPTGTIFMSTASGGLHRSTDMGLTFVQVANGPNAGGNYMQALPSGRLLAIAGGKLFASDDDGITWQAMNVSLGGWWGMQQIPALGDGSIFSTALESLFKSSDGGQSWQFAAAGIREVSIERMRFFTDSIIYASTTTALWKTTDSGEHWSRLTNDETGNGDKSFELSASGGIVHIEAGRLWWSANGENPMTDISPADTLDPIWKNDIFVNPWNNHLYTNTLSGFSRSAGPGQNWSGTAGGRFIRTMGFHASGRVFATDDDMNLLFSDNDGNAWDLVQIPGVAASGDVKVATNGDVYAACRMSDNDFVLFKSPDTGVSWAPISDDLNQYHLSSNDLLQIAANAILLRTNSETEVYLSANDGRNWQTLPEPTGIPGIEYTTHGIFISPDQYLYTNNYEGCFRTVSPVTRGAYISGYARLDADADCSTPDAQQGLRNWIVQAAGPFDYFTQTGPDGHYTFFVDTGAYAVSLAPVNDIWWSICDSAQTVVLDSLFAADTVDFAVVSSAECPLVTVDVALPILRRCFDNKAWIQYCNQGSQPADSAWVDVELDPYMAFVSSDQPHNDLGNNTYRFFLGDVASGDCGQFSFVVHVDCDSTVLGQTHCISVHGYPDTLCSSVPDWSGAEIRAEIECADSLLRLKLRNAGNATSQTLDYIIIEDDVVLLNGNNQYAPGEIITLDRPANGHTWRIESIQEPGHPFSVRAVAFAEGCGGFESLGFINRFEVNSFQPSYDVVCLENIGAYDPNDKQGFPIGAGPEHRIRPGQDIEYLIRFQNTGTDTAFTVVIVDSLSQWLDPASLRPGAASHAYFWQLDGQGVIKFTFANILLPDSNVNLAASQGFVSFKIAQQPNVPLNTQIFNEAGIYFDFNQPVITNRTLHTVGFDESVATAEAGTEKTENHIIVAPNPVRESTVFSRRTGAFDRHHIEISDAGGRVLHSAGISGKQYLFQRKNLPEGVYFFRISDKSGNPVDAGVLMLSGH